MGVHAHWREREGDRGGWESTCKWVCVKICLDEENNMLQCDVLYLCFY